MVELDEDRGQSCASSAVTILGNSHSVTKTGLSRGKHNKLQVSEKLELRKIRPETKWGTVVFTEGF
jgi:hypothetical protein